MPEGKITGNMLRDHFRRLWLVYLVGIVLMFFLNNVIFDVTRPDFSDDETLKIMLLNADAALSEDALLEDVRDLGFGCVELLPLAYAPEDPSSRMLVYMQLTGGFGDIWITDAAGLELLLERDACLRLDGVEIAGLVSVEKQNMQTGQGFTAALRLPGENYIVVARNGTTPDAALKALVSLTKNME